MPRPNRTAPIALAASLLATVSGAQSLEFWGASGLWEVLVDPTLGNGCLIQTEYTDGSVVRIGFDNLASGAYVTVFNDNWGDIEEGAVYNIAFTLDDAEYSGEGTGIYLAEVPGIDIAFDNPDFLLDLAQRYTMTLYDSTSEVMTADLEGSDAALEAALDCQYEQGG